MFLKGKKLSVGDFGQSILTKGNVNHTKTRTNKEAFGTDSYLAPEVVNEEGDYTRSTSIDIWQVLIFVFCLPLFSNKDFNYKFLLNVRSFGCIVYEMASFKKLFADSTQVKIRQKIVNFDANKQLENIKNVLNQSVHPLIYEIIKM